jgi:AcrR family transcriptional regulator
VVETLNLRERKKQRTRRALVAAAVQLFKEQGYAETTLAQIAAAAEVSTPTLLNYFSSKEEIFLVEDRHRLRVALRTIAEREADEGPADLLVRVTKALLASYTQTEDGAGDGGRLPGDLRLRLTMAEPKLQAHALRLFQDAQRELVDALHEAFPGRIDRATAAGMIGALLGAAQISRLISLEQGDTPDQVLAATQYGIDIALGGVQAAANAADPSADGKRLDGTARTTTQPRP